MQGEKNKKKFKQEAKMMREQILVLMKKLEDADRISSAAMCGGTNPASGWMDTRLVSASSTLNDSGGFQNSPDT
eukprot:SAG31_NODE_1271_length_9064_cov_10.148912_2_plen_74_part_00